MKDTDYFSIWERVGYEGKKQDDIHRGVSFRWFYKKILDLWKGWKN